MTLPSPQSCLLNITANPFPLAPQNCSPLDGREVHYADIAREASSSPRELGQVEVTLCYNDNLQRLTVVIGATKGIKVGAASSQAP